MEKEIFFLNCFYEKEKRANLGVIIQRGEEYGYKMCGIANARKKFKKDFSLIPEDKRQYVLILSKTYSKIYPAKINFIVWREKCFWKRANNKAGFISKNIYSWKLLSIAESFYFPPNTLLLACPVMSL